MNARPGDDLLVRVVVIVAVASAVMLGLMAWQTWAQPWLPETSGFTTMVVGADAAACGYVVVNAAAGAALPGGAQEARLPNLGSSRLTTQ